MKPNFDKIGKGFYFAKINVMSKQISAKKRWIISTVLTFLSIFFLEFFTSLQEAILTGEITSQIILAVLWGAAAVAARSVLKGGWERYNGQI